MYLVFVSEYGSPADVSLVAPKVSNLFTIQIQSTSQPDHSTVSKRVSRKMSVQALQGIAMKLFGCGAAVNGITLPQLSYMDHIRSGIKIPMDNLSKSLDYYSIQEGDIVIVDW